MKHPAQLSAVLMLGVALLGCAERTDSGAAHAYRLAHAPPLPAASPPASDEAGALPAPPEAADQELEAFEERLRLSCHVAADPISTAEMLGYSRALEQCAEQRIHALLAKLPAPRRAELSSAPLATFQAAACTLEDAQEFSGRARTAGTMRAVTRASCRSFATQRALYWLELYAARDTATFARHVRRRAEAGRRAESQQAKLASYAAALATTAPETGLEDDACPLCTLGDADFRKLLRAQATVQTAAKDLARRACSTWLELAAALGGSDGCQSELRSYWLVEAGGGYGEPFDDARWSSSDDEDEEEHDPNLPPAKDPDYAAVVEPLYAACEAENPSAEPLARTTCLRRLAREKLTQLPSARRADLERIETAWQRFAQQLCIVDDAALPFAKAQLASYGEATCHLLQTARGAHLMSRWANREVNELHRHILARREWANRANAGLLRLASALTAKRAQGALKQLLPARHELAHALCSTWPGLDDTIETCDELLELHLLSYGQHWGAVGVTAP